MQVHAIYSLELATMGSNRDEIQALAARRAAEVRQRLASAAKRSPVVDDEDVDFVRASDSAAAGTESDLSGVDQGQPFGDPEVAPESPPENGVLFSALA